MKSRNFIITTVVCTLVLLIGFASITFYVDPLFHYHKPNEKLQYPLYDERYMNYGIVDHFDYDSVITGTSMTENFKTSQFDNYFESKSIKVPFSGATYHEINRIVNRAFESKHDLKYVMFSLDSTELIVDKDELNYDEYPDYLYDRNPFNDVYYLLNKDIYLTFTEYVFTFMRLGGNSTDFDTYKNWSGLYEYNYDKMINEHERWEKREEKRVLSDEDIRIMTDNLETNIISLVKKHPDTQFYLFVPPYSLCFFDDLYQDGDIDRMIAAWELEAQMLLEYDNVHLFSFFDEVETVANLANYIDKLHYSQAISDHIIDCMATGEHQLTKTNYKEYFRYISDFYNAFDYDGLFAAE